MFKKGKDRKEKKTVVCNSPPTKILFQYLPFSAEPNQLKIADVTEGYDF